MECKYVSVEEVIDIHSLIIYRFGGLEGIRDHGSLKSAVNQPRMTFDSIDLYSTIPQKASALCFFIVKNHPFVDGNKRVGYMAMRSFLRLNGFRIRATVDEQEKIIKGLAGGTVTKDEFTKWVENHSEPLLSILCLTEPLDRNSQGLLHA